MKTESNMKKKSVEILYLYGRWLYMSIGGNDYIKNITKKRLQQ